MSRHPPATTIVPLIALAGALFASVTSVAHQAHSAEAALYQRAKDLQATLSGKGVYRVADFIDPVDRGAPDATSLLADDAFEFLHAQVAMIEKVDVERGGRRGRSDHTILRRGMSSTGGESIPDHFIWMRGADGKWYIDLAAERQGDDR